MKAFDSNIERNGRDGGFDLLANRALSREIDSSLRSQIGERSGLSVATNYFAIACPIMPLGLLGAFMLLDKLGAPTDPAEKLKTQEMARRNGDLTQALYVAAMKQRMDIEKKQTGLACSRPIEGLIPSADKRVEKNKKQSELMLDGKRSERLNGPVLLSKAQTDVAKVVKKKMALQSHLEKMNQEQEDYGAVCRVSARIELLEKALKRMGC